jgi:hypothetical protein
MINLDSLGRLLYQEHQDPANHHGRSGYSSTAC